jgi:serine/threonine protein kinase
MCECDGVIAQFSHVPALRKAIQQRDELHAQLEAAEESEDYQLATKLARETASLQKLIALQPLSEEDYLMLPDRHAALVLKLAQQCEELVKATNWAALKALAAKLEQLKALDVRAPSLAPVSVAAGRVLVNEHQQTRSGTLYASNDVPITDIQELHNTQPGLRAASVRLMLRGEFRTPDSAGVIHMYRCVIKCASHAAGVVPSVTNRLRREHAMYQEAQRLASTVGTGCVRCYSLDPTGLYMVLEQHGTDLRALLNADLRSPQMVMEGIVSAVHALHSVNIMHGDIKPGNLLVQLTLQGHYIVKLCDLDCARKVGEVCEAVTLGTKHYLAPEVRVAAASRTGTVCASTAVDMFALGLVLWQVMKRCPTAALDCDSEARLDQLQSDQVQLNAHLLYRDFMERVEALGRHNSSVLVDNAALNNMVQTLIAGTHIIPALAIVLPEVSTSWESVKHPMRLLRNQFRLYFLCSHTKQIAPCGPQGKGYRIQVTKQWVQDAAPVLRVGLVLVKVALLASGMPLPVPDLCSALADGTKHYKYLDIALQLLKCPPNLGDAEYVMQTTLDSVEAYNVNDLLSDQSAADPISALQLQEGSRKAYEAIREVLVAQGHFALTCGLRQVTCSRTGRTAWVLDNDVTERAWRDDVAVSAAPAPGSPISLAATSVGPAAALDCDDGARLDVLYFDQAQFNTHLRYPAPYRDFMERVTCLEPARRPNAAELWRHIQPLGVTNEGNAAPVQGLHQTEADPSTRDEV